MAVVSPAPTEASVIATSGAFIITNRTTESNPTADSIITDVISLLASIATRASTTMATPVISENHGRHHKDHNPVISEKTFIHLHPLQRAFG